MQLYRNFQNCLSAALAVSLTVTSVQNSALAIPTKTVTVEGRTVQAPDFDALTFEALPPTTSAGALNVSPEVIDYLGFDPSTSWAAGQEPETFLKLGSLFGFSVEEMSLQEIAELTGTALGTLGLDQFQVMEWQSTTSLIAAIPGLKNATLQSIAPLSDLFEKYGITADMTVGDAVQTAPEVASKLLGEELNLGKYTIADVPGLKEVPIQKYKDWELANLEGIPALAKVYWNDFPVPPPGVIRAIAPIDFTWSDAEIMSADAIPHVMSGSIEPRSGTITIPVPPPMGKKIPYLELADYSGSSGLTYGNRWFAGSYQDVPGGYGVLKAVNNGKEPTGLATYGPLFKVVLEETDETTGQATFNIYFRYCLKTAFFDFGCTPYYLGPISWIPARETEAVVVSASY